MGRGKVVGRGDMQREEERGRSGQKGDEERGEHADNDTLLGDP